MYCKYCGAQCADGTVYCPSCGGKLQDVETRDSAAAPQYTYQYPTAQDGSYQQAAQYPMGWYKFLIYFALFAGAVLNLYNGITLFTGSIYGDVSPDVIYDVFSGLKAVDVIFAILTIGLAAFSIYVRQLLAHYRVSAPTMLNVVYIWALLINILYPIVVSVITELPFGDLIDATYVSSIVTAAVMLYINTVYFKKRAELFVK